MASIQKLIANLADDPPRGKTYHRWLPLRFRRLHAADTTTPPRPDMMKIRAAASRITHH